MKRETREQIIESFDGISAHFKDRVHEVLGEVCEGVHLETVMVLVYCLSRVAGVSDVFNIGVEKGGVTLTATDDVFGDGETHWDLLERDGDPRDGGFLEVCNARGLPHPNKFKGSGLGLGIYVYCLLLAHQKGKKVKTATKRKGARNAWKRLIELGLASQIQTDYAYFAESNRLSFLPPDALSGLMQLAKEFRLRD